MTVSVNAPAALSPALAHLYAPIAGELAEVERRLRQELQSEFPYVDELVRYGCLLGGKRLRPALVLLSAQATGQCRPQHILLATVVEMIHTATLVHDDVLDEAQLRRHLATVNARWDDEASILLGDFLFSHAFYLASTLESTAACRIIGRSTNIVCEGELRQKGSRGNFSLTEDEYFGIIDAKTAELTACSCRLGALYAGAEEEAVEALAAYGRDLGLAFQMADDLLDVVGEERTTGKSLGTDLDQHKPTLPIIHAVQHAPPAERERLLAILASDDPQPALLEPFFERLGSVEYARQKAQSLAARAARRLDPLPASAAKDVLLTMAEFVVSRAH